MALYGQDRFLTGDPTQVAGWLSSTPTSALKDLGARLRARREADIPIPRSTVDSWVRDCSRRTGGGTGNGNGNNPPRGSDEYKPPQVGAKDHKTVRDRLQYQSRGLHIPYVRSAAYDQKVPANKWTRADIRAHDDPYKLTSGNGVVLNQDGLWTFVVKTDWSVGHAEVMAGAAQATRFMVNGSDIGLRDYLDDDAYSASLPINTFTWTDQFRAGTRINIDVRTEGLGEGFTAVCNVYLRAYLVRCFDGACDMAGFPLPPDPKPKPIPDPPLMGYVPTVPSQPAQPQPKPSSCPGDDSKNNFLFTVNDTGQVGQYKCVGGQTTVVWTSYGWDGGSYFGGGVVGGSGATAGGPGRPTYSGSY